MLGLIRDSGIVEFHGRKNDGLSLVGDSLEIRA